MEGSPDEALHRVDRVFRIAQAPLASHFADENAAVRMERDHRRDQLSAPSTSRSTRACAASATATTELVVPRSMPRTTSEFTRCPFGESESLGNGQVVGYDSDRRKTW